MSGLPTILLIAPEGMLGTAWVELLDAKASRHTDSNKLYDFYGPLADNMSTENQVAFPVDD